jgi:hypothetical protein
MAKKKTEVVPAKKRDGCPPGMSFSDTLERCVKDILSEPARLVQEAMRDVAKEIRRTELEVVKGAAEILDGSKKLKDIDPALDFLAKKVKAKRNDILNWYKEKFRVR